MKSSIVVFILYFLFNNFFQCESANILGIFPSPGYSQFILGEKLMRELANRNHSVTVISAFKPAKEIPNYKTILVKELTAEEEENMFNLEKNIIFENIILIHKLGLFITEAIFANKEVQNLISSSAKFDLVIVEKFFNDGHMNFAQHFKAPLVSLSSTGVSEWNTYLLSGIYLPTITPVSFAGYHNHMKFMQRIRNSAAFLFGYFYGKFVSLPMHQKLSDKYLQNHYDLFEIRSNISLMLLNSHPVTSEAVLLPSSAKEVGGYHIETKPLPKNLKSFLDGAENGAILFSMGTNLKSKDLSKEKLQEIVEVISKLPQRVLWKFEADNLENQPKNLLIQKWLPQTDILEHPNTVAFITHGGLLSITEAVMFGVPVIGIPIFGDQKMNMARACKNGFGILIRYPDFGKESLSKAVKEIVENPTYRENARRLSNLLRDEPVRSLDLAIHSAEQVIKNLGATHLRLASQDLHWIQILGLDIIIFILATILVVILSLKKLLKSLTTKKVETKSNLKKKTKAKKQ